MLRQRVRLVAVALVVLAGAVGAVSVTTETGRAEAAANYYDAAGREGTVYRLYRAYFLREPDQGGFMHWYVASFQGWSLQRISDFFAGSQEFHNRYGTLDDRAFVGLVYQNVLGREPDSGGYNFWTGEIRSGMTRGTVMVKFSDTVEYKRKTNLGVPPGFRAGSNARALLDTLPVAGERRSGYDRDLFKHWDDEDRDGCDTRCEVLAAERYPNGHWYSHYDGTWVTSASGLHIDHVVALAEAWDSGAHAWDPGRRDRFADWAVNLISVSASTNQSKSDKDPAEWSPPRAASRCLIAEVTVTTKAAWQLSVDQAEKSTLASWLNGCHAGSSNPGPAPTTAPPTTQPPVGCASAGSYTPAGGGCVADYEDHTGDVDCGQLPAWMKPVAVHGNDYYRLDGNNDGLGCES